MGWVRIQALSAFALMGAFWGAWGASIPRIQRQTDLGDGALGIALLCIGAGALPAMLWAGRLIDRYGLRVAGVMLPAMGAAGAVTSLAARGLVSLSACLAAVGATSGAYDVAINAVAGRAETLLGGAVITRSHGTFSALVVVASLATGAAAAAALPVWAPFLAVAGISVVVGLTLARTLPGPAGHAAADEPDRPPERGRFLLPLLITGFLGALAVASENAHQSWSAVFTHDVLHSSAALAAGAPALYAAVVAGTRLSASRRLSETVVMAAGGATAAIGATLLAAASNLAVAAGGLVLAAIGTGVLFPTVMRVVSRSTAETHRGRATSVVATVSYLGFLAGPVYVGAWAHATGLRGAMFAVAGLGLALAVLAPPLLRVAEARRD